MSESRQAYPRPGFDKPEPLHQVLEAALGTFEALRRLGFLPQHLFIEYAGGFKPALVRYRIRDGAHPDFIVVDDIAADDFQAAWSAKARWWKDAIERRDPECERIYQRWLAKVDRLGLILALQARGYEIGAATGGAEA